ncbi:MAG TPA: DUF882 domain-containing protein [Desulfobacterales bacterium]|nr:DUF882 domain-containing protein [Desulfobacterales bacterium]
MQCNRRYFLKFGIFSVMASFQPALVLAHAKRSLPSRRSLSFYNTQTTERLFINYYSKGKYKLNALEEINYILRDHRTGETRSIDIRLLDLLCAISQKLNTRSPFHVISGYRSPATNAMLRKKSRRVAKNSLHVRGKAVDIRLPKFKTALLRRTSMDLKQGGVGYYRRSNFVHVDVGRIRYW